MNRLFFIAIMTIALALSFGCTPARQAHAAQAQPHWCVSSGQAIDSAFMVDAARRVLDPRGRGNRLKPVMFQFVPHGASQPMGAVISMVVDSPQPPLGGGGLVWVDAETGCAIPLRGFE